MEYQHTLFQQLFGKLVNLVGKRLENKMFLLNYSTSNILLTRDSLLSNISRYQEVWSEYISKHNTSNFFILGDQIQNLLWKMKNTESPYLEFSFFVEEIICIITPLRKSLVNLFHLKFPHRDNVIVPRL